MYLSREQVRALDRQAIEEYGVPGVVLMENAGRSAADVLYDLIDLGNSGPVVLCCGKGNNGGDGFVMARHLDNFVAVEILLFAHPNELSADAAVNYRIAERSGIGIHVWPSLSVTQQVLASANWVVDALFGTGLTGPLRSPFDEAVAAINASGKNVLSLDIPSGLDCDTGRPLGPSVRAKHTVTFVAMKKGFAAATAKEWLGKVHVVHIGEPRKLRLEFNVY